MACSESIAHGSKEKFFESTNKHQTTLISLYNISMIVPDRKVSINMHHATLITLISLYNFSILIPDRKVSIKQHQTTLITLIS